jgi:hypothetical protein
MQCDSRGFGGGVLRARSEARGGRRKTGPCGPPSAENIILNVKAPQRSQGHVPVPVAVTMQDEGSLGPTSANGSYYDSGCASDELHLNLPIGVGIDSGSLQLNVLIPRIETASADGMTDPLFPYERALHFGPPATGWYGVQAVLEDGRTAAYSCRVVHDEPLRCGPGFPKSDALG